MDSQSTVLIVDDNALARETIKHILSELNCRCVEAETGEHALKLIQRTPLDAIILDLKLPGIDGLETLRRAAEKRPSLAPVIVLTGYARFDTAFEAGRLDVFDYIEKADLSGGALKDAVGRALRSNPGTAADDTQAVTEDFFRWAGFNVRRASDGLLVSMPQNSEWERDGKIFVRCVGRGKATKRDVRAVGRKVSELSQAGGTGFLAHPEDLALGAARQIFEEKKNGVFVIPMHVPRAKRLMSSADADECYRHLVGLKRMWSAMADPYESLDAISDPQWFFGQEDLLKQIRAHLGSSSEKHLVIHGMRKSGKTALLNQVGLLTRAKGIPTAKWVARRGEDFQTVLYNLVAELAESLREIYGGVEVPPRESLSAYQANPGASFKGDWQKLCQAGQKISGDVPRLVWLIDELDINNFFPWQGDRREDYVQYCNLFQTLKEVTEAAARPPLTLIVACEYFWVDEVNRFPYNRRFQNPLYRRFLRFPLTFLTRSELSQLVRQLGELAGLEYTSEGIDYIYSETRGHPQITRWLCSCVRHRVGNAGLDGGVTPAVVSEAINYFLYESGGEIYRNYFEQVFWSDPLSPDVETDQHLLAELALGDVYPVEDLILRLCEREGGGSRRDKVSAAISRLRAMGIIEELAERQSLYLTIPLYKRWVRSEKLGIIEPAEETPHAAIY